MAMFCGGVGAYALLRRRRRRWESPTTRWVKTPPKRSNTSVYVGVSNHYTAAVPCTDLQQYTCTISTEKATGRYETMLVTCYEMRR